MKASKVAHHRASEGDSNQWRTSQTAWLKSNQETENDNIKKAYMCCY